MEAPQKRVPRSKLPLLPIPGSQAQYQREEAFTPYCKGIIYLLCMLQSYLTEWVNT